jgi:hypothetical protein
MSVDVKVPLQGLFKQLAFVRNATELPRFKAMSGKIINHISMHGYSKLGVLALPPLERPAGHPGIGQVARLADCNHPEAATTNK